MSMVLENKYRTRAIITRGLYLFYPIFHCGLYLRAVYTAERLVITWFFFSSKVTTKKSEIDWKLSKKESDLVPGWKKIHVITNLSAV